jgi:hypothetical protein
MAIQHVEFRRLVEEAFGPLCRAYGLRMPAEGSLALRLDGAEMFLTVAYDASRSRELVSSFGLQAGVVHAVQRPFQLSELLRAVGQYDLPEAQMQEIVASHDEVAAALHHLAGLYTAYGQDALRGDRALFSRLDAQRDLDCWRYEHDRDLDRVSRAAYVAWAHRQYDAVASLLSPFKERLTTDERRMLDLAKAQLPKG